jgi:hypothetical protein
MSILTIATTVGFVTLLYYIVPMIHRAWVLRKRGVPELPKRALPPHLPQAADSEDDGAHLLEQARRRRYEAMGIADEYHPHEW